MADEIKAIQPNLLGMALARALRTGRDVLDMPGRLPEDWPVVGGMSAGDVIFGKSPEAVEDYAHGFGPLSKGQGLTTRVDPRVLDIAGLPLMGTAAALPLRGMMMAKALRGGGVNASRRKFLQQAGSLTASPVVNAPIPSTLAKFAAPAAATVAAATIPAAAPMTMDALLAAIKSSMAKKVQNMHAELATMTPPQTAVDEQLRAWLGNQSPEGLTNYLLNSLDETYVPGKTSSQFGRPFIEKMVGDAPLETVNPETIANMMDWNLRDNSWYGYFTSDKNPTALQKETLSVPRPERVTAEQMKEFTDPMRREIAEAEKVIAELAARNPDVKIFGDKVEPVNYEAALSGHEYYLRNLKSRLEHAESFIDKPIPEKGYLSLPYEMETSIRDKLVMAKLLGKEAELNPAYGLMNPGRLQDLANEIRGTSIWSMRDRVADAMRKQPMTRGPNGRFLKKKELTLEDIMRNIVEERKANE